jgi:hypothetical protein
MIEMKISQMFGINKQEDGKKGSGYMDLKTRKDTFSVLMDLSQITQILLEKLV